MDENDAEALRANGCFLVAEGANMPCTPVAIDIFHNSGILYASGKMSNGGGVGCSSLEMAQNASKSRWTREEVDNKLKVMMKHIYDSSITQSRRFGCSLMDGGNIAGFLRVVQSMENQGKLF